MTTILSATNVSKLEPTPGRDRFVFEKGGFGVRISPTGKRSWLLRAKVNGVPRRFALGYVGDVPITEARKAAHELKGKLAKGDDPVAERKAEAAADVTLRTFWEGFERRGKASDKKAITLKGYRDVMERWVLPDLGDRPVRSLTRADAWALHGKIGKPDKDGVSKRRTANKTIQALRAVLSDAADKGVLPNNINPLTKLKLPGDNQRQVFLDDDAIAATIKTLDELTGHGVSEMSAAFLKTMLLTGARGGELQKLEWAMIDEDRQVAVLPMGKNGDPRVIPLAGAWDIITKLPKAGRLVFWGRSPELPFVKFRDAWRKVREKAGLPDVKPHDLRHSFASVVLAQNYSLPIVGALLGHRSVASTKRYAHMASTAINDVAVQAANAIRAAGKGGKATATVTQQPKAKAKTLKVKK